MNSLTKASAHGDADQVRSQTPAVRREGADATGDMRGYADNQAERAVAADGRRLAAHALDVGAERHRHAREIFVPNGPVDGEHSTALRVTETGNDRRQVRGRDVARRR